MKFKIKDEDLVTRDLAEAVSCLSLKMRLEAVTPAEMLRVLKPQEID